MKKSKHKESFLKPPEYPGGKKAMDRFISSHLKYPEEALKNNISGRVYVTFWVDREGQVTNAKVLSGLGYGCDEEAIRLVRLLQYSQQNNHGKRISIQRKLHIHFRLPKAVTPPVSGGYHYTYTETEKKTPAITYTYTINRS